MLVPALGAQLVQAPLQTPEVVAVQPARPLAAVDVLGQLLRVLGADELVVVRGADVDQRPYGRGGRFFFSFFFFFSPVRRLGARGLRLLAGGVEGGVVDGVPVYLPDVEVLFYFLDVVGFDAVGDAPDFVVGRRGVGVAQRGPVGAGDEGYDASWCGGCAAVVLAVGGVVSWWMEDGGGTVRERD